MSKSFTRIRRVVVPMLTALVILSQTAPAAFAMSADDVASLAATNQQVEIIQNMPDNNAAVNLSAAGASYTVLANNTNIMDQFSDWNKEQGGWWFGRESVVFSVTKGYITGKEANGEKFVAGSDTITTGEFVTVLTRMCLDSAKLSQYQADSAKAEATKAAEHKAQWIADQQTQDAFDGKTVRSEAELGALYDSSSAKYASHWSAGYMYAAEQSGLLTGTGLTAGDASNKCTRANMAKLLVNALKARGEDVTKANVTKAVAAMSDTLDIQSSGASQEIGTAIAMGLIAGDNNKAFNPSGTMDRASACEIFQRLDNPSGQREAVIKQVGLDGSNTSINGGGGGNQTVSGPITIDMRDTSTSHREPREGDTIIRPDGSSVVLKRDATTGVLGYGQNVGAWLNTKTQFGAVSENAWTDAVTQGWSDQLAMGSYMKSPIAGQESTYHWTNEWAAIMKSTSPNRAGIKGTEGQVDSTGLWVYRNVLGSWEWQGPSC